MSMPSISTADCQCMGDISVCMDVYFQGSFLPAIVIFKFCPFTGAHEDGPYSEEGIVEYALLAYIVLKD